MSMERAQFLGQREELRNKAVRLKAGINALQNSVRCILNPFVEIEDVNVVDLQEQAYELAEKIQQYKELKLKIRAISKELGGR